MHIVNAGYNRWSTPPPSNSDVPEKGIDLALIVQNWPQDASPLYIVYENRKSFRPEITRNSDIGVAMSARIILASSVLSQKSERVEVSDRLVYETADGETGYLEIKEWTRIGD